MRYAPVTLAFKTRPLPDGTVLAVSSSGDHSFLTSSELTALRDAPSTLPFDLQTELKSRFFIGAHDNSGGTRRLIKSRVAAKRETVNNGPSLHIFVPTLQCTHSCRYCQVSRSQVGDGYTMSLVDLDSACETIFQSASKSLTVEFQGGDPLLRFDLIRHAILRIKSINGSERRNLRFVVASTLHHLDDDMCSFFLEHNVLLSTSLDGPENLHNKNRPIPGKNAYERTVTGLELARRRLGHNSVSALMTTTRDSLAQPEAIVDEYVRLGFSDVFLRPLSLYGFARRNKSILGYSSDEFFNFYFRGLERVIYWNQQGVKLREVYASIILNKILSTFDQGYVNLQSPTGAGLSVLVYNYDGFVYPTDEARMLVESGDTSLRLGRIGQPITELLGSALQQDLIRSSLVDCTPGCMDCAYNLFCAPDPVDAHADFGSVFAPVAQTSHCQRHLRLFDEIFMRVRKADERTLTLFHQWAMPTR